MKSEDQTILNLKLTYKRVASIFSPESSFLPCQKSNNEDNCKSTKKGTHQYPSDTIVSCILKIGNFQQKKNKKE